jgi:hypothetical protein
MKNSNISLVKTKVWFNIQRYRCRIHDCSRPYIDSESTSSV